MRSLTIFLSIMALIFLAIFCSEPTEPQKEKEVFTVVVTGNVNELTPTGSQPLAGCNVTLIATNFTTTSKTDSNGVFLDTLVTSDDTFRIKIEKAGFSTIDTVLQRNNLNSLSFIMDVSDTFISGTITENVHTGSQPSDSCRISIITSTGTTITYSDQNGAFSSDVSTADITVRILLEKDGFGTIDTTIQSSAAQNLNFTIDFNRIEVSGRIYDINENGTYPFPNCEIKIYSGIWPTGNWNIIYSNNLGYFEFQTTNFNNSVRIIVDIVSYVILDTTVSIQNSTSLELFLEKYVNYFPLKVGNKWKYYGEYYPGGDYFWYDYEGEECWELTDLAYDSSWFKIVTDFTGLKILMLWGTPIDTTYLYNEIAELSLNNNNGILSLNSATGSDISLLKWFFDTLNPTGITKPRITYPVNSGDTISVFIEDDFDFLKYDLIKNIGFDTLEAQYRPIDITIIHAYLGLLEYNIQK